MHEDWEIIVFLDRRKRWYFHLDFGHYDLRI